MDLSDLDDDPLVALRGWIDAARAAGAPLAEAMAVATVRLDGAPAARMVIMRGLDSGPVFYTDRESQKGEEIAALPRAAALFHWWVPTHRQVRVTGAVSAVEDALSDAYWASRPPGSRRSAVSSHQSSVIDDRAKLVATAQSVEHEYPDDSAIERPQRWGGYRIAPTEIEFWEEGPDRLHDRIRYLRDGPGWRRERLSP